MSPVKPNLDPSGNDTPVASKSKVPQGSPTSRSGAILPPKATDPNAPRAKPLPFSLMSLNPFTFSKPSSAAHASRLQPGVPRVPPNYNQVARKVTAALVAAPVAIVMSWLLWERCEHDRTFLIWRSGTNTWLIRLLL